MVSSRLHVLLHTCCLIALAFHVAIISVNSGKLKFPIAKRTKECFFHEIKSSGEGDIRSLEFEYEVISGGDLDISVSVSSPTKQRLLNKLSSFDPRRKTVESVQSQKIALGRLESDGIYEICFDNMYASKDTKILQFTFADEYLGNKTTSQIVDKGKTEKKDLLKVTELDILTEMAQKLNIELSKMSEYQEYNRNRLHRHLWTQHSTNSRASWSTMLEISLIVIVVACQTYYIQTWFKAKQFSFSV